MLNYYIKPLWKNANSNFSGNFGPEVSIDFNRRGFELLNSVEKPDFHGFLWKLEAFENCQFLVRKKS